MLKLRRGTVVSADPLEVETGGEVRRAWADPGSVGPCQAGDEVIVNTAALDLELGSGGFDIVHVNLSRGLEGGDTPEGVHVIKLNYSSLQHAVDPIESPAGTPPRPRRRIPVLVFQLHGHLAPAIWAAAQARSELKIGYVQTAGGALPGALSRDVATLRERDLLAGHITVAPTYGGELEAISTVGALHAAAMELDWDAVIAGPGPGILGSASRYGHGGMAALDTLHGSLALGLPTLLCPRLSSGDPRSRHRGISHHSRAVLELALAPVRVPYPINVEQHWPADHTRSVLGTLGQGIDAVCGESHVPDPQEVDLDGYKEAGLPTRTMGRGIEEDPLFFSAPLAAGAALAAAS